MSNRIDVVVDGKVVGTVPAFANGSGKEVKAQLEAGLGSSIQVKVLYSDVAHIDAASLDAAKRLPGFSPEGSHPPFRMIPIGSPEAIERGCICKQAINPDGSPMVGNDGRPLYAAEKHCPVHG